LLGAERTQAGKRKGEAEKTAIAKERHHPEDGCGGELRLESKVPDRGCQLGRVTDDSLPRHHLL
jgi:hypothetical protein